MVAAYPRQGGGLQVSEGVYDLDGFGMELEDGGADSCDGAGVIVLEDVVRFYLLDDGQGRLVRGGTGPIVGDGGRAGGGTRAQRRGAGGVGRDGVAAAGLGGREVGSALLLGEARQLGQEGSAGCSAQEGCDGRRRGLLGGGGGRDGDRDRHRLSGLR
jgi:hypothetical protein